MARDGTSAPVPCQSVSNMLVVGGSVVPDVSSSESFVNAVPFHFPRQNSMSDERLAYTICGPLLLSRALPT